jgi:hypothetical protein
VPAPGVGCQFRFTLSYRDVEELLAEGSRCHWRTLLARLAVSSSPRTTKLLLSAGIAPPVTFLDMRQPSTPVYQAFGRWVRVDRFRDIGNVIEPSALINPCGNEDRKDKDTVTSNSTGSPPRSRG